MKLEQNEGNILFSHTDLPDIFFTEYLASANGNYIKVYLYILFLSKYNKDIKVTDLSKCLSLDFEILKEAMQFWEQLGVITRKNQGYILNNLQEIELNKLYKPKLSLSPESAEKNKEKIYRAKAVEDINNRFFQGIMSPSWYYDIELWFKKYSFDEQVMIALFNYCFDKSALHRNYVQVVANSWSKSNVKTYNDLENYFEKQEKLNKVKKFISKKLGLNRDLSQYEQSYIEKWIVDYNFQLDIIEIALKRTTLKTNPSFDYLDKLLTDWHERKFISVEEITAFIESIKTKNKNVKALENNTNYKNYEQRKYDNLDSLYTNIKNK